LMIHGHSIQLSKANWSHRTKSLARQFVHSGPVQIPLETEGSLQNR